MEELREKKPNTIIKIAADGDVILIIGPEEVKLRVHSLFMKATSKPFSAMLGPNWKEGHSMLNQAGPVEISLPEDNADALEVICAVIHHQNNKVSQTLSACDILGVAVTADKYDCIDALRFASGNWLRPGKSEAGDLMLLAATAYLFRNAQAFKEITKALIFDYSGPYLALLCEEVESIIPWKIFCLLEAQRSFARLEFAEILISGINGAGCAYKCGWKSKYAFAYLELLESNSLWPARLSNVSISQAMKLAETIHDPIPEEKSVECTHKYRHVAPEYRTDRSWKLQHLNDSVGLCLYCVRSGSTDFNCSQSSHKE